MPTTPCELESGRKSAVRRLKFFGCPAIFKIYKKSEKGKTIKSNYLQQGMEGVLVGIQDDSAGWLFYVLNPRRLTYLQTHHLMSILPFIYSVDQWDGTFLSVEEPQQKEDDQKIMMAMFPLMIKN